MISEDAEDLDFGDVVVMAPYVGVFVGNAFGHEMVRFLGDGESEIGDFILAKLEDDRIQPLKGNVLVRLDLPDEKVGSLYVARKTPKGTATVCEVHADAKDAKVGHRVFLRSSAVARGVTFADKWVDKYGEGLAFVKESDIYGSY